MKRQIILLTSPWNLHPDKKSHKTWRVDHLTPSPEVWELCTKATTNWVRPGWRIVGRFFSNKKRLSCHFVGMCRWFLFWLFWAAIPILRFLEVDGPKGSFWNRWDEMMKRWLGNSQMSRQPAATSPSPRYVHLLQLWCTSCLWQSLAKHYRGFGKRSSFDKFFVASIFLNASYYI